MLASPDKLRNLYFPYRLFTVFALLFLFGILAQSFLGFSFDRSWPIFIFITILFLFSGFVNFWLKNKILVLVSFALTFLILGLVYYSYFEKMTFTKLPFGQEVAFEGKIVSHPDIDYKSQKMIVEYETNGQNNRILVTLPHFPEYHFGEIIHVTGKIEEPVNFSDFDYRGYLKQKLVFGLMKNPSVVYLGQSGAINDRFLAGLYFASSYFENALNKTVSEPQASLASGILLGVKRDIPTELSDNLNKTGLTHIIALSGFNVTIIVAIFASLLMARIGRRRVFFFGSVLVIIFVLLTGGSSSVVRAAIFSLLILFGSAFGRQADQTNIMILAALAMVLINPFVLRYDTGFQLSFLAFSGLIYISPRLKNFFQKERFRKIPATIILLLSETLGAQIAVAPLIFFQFGRFSLISPVANILVVPLIPFAMGLIFITGLGSMVYLPLGQLISFLLWPILEYIIQAVNFLARIPFSSLGK